MYSWCCWWLGGGAAAEPGALIVTGILAPGVIFLGYRSLKEGRPFGRESGFFSGDSFGGGGGSAISRWFLCGRSVSTTSVITNEDSPTELEL